MPPPLVVAARTRLAVIGAAPPPARVSVTEVLPDTVIRKMPPVPWNTARRPSLPTSVAPPAALRPLVTGLIVTLPPAGPLSSVPKSRSSVLISVFGRTTAALAVAFRSAAWAGGHSAAPAVAMAMAMARAQTSPRLCLVPRIPTDSAPVWHRLCQRDLHRGCMGLVKAAFTSADAQPLSAMPPALNFYRRCHRSGQSEIGRASCRERVCQYV